MATAKKIKVPKVVETKVDAVELVLSPAEARTLAAMMYVTGGHRDESPRKHAQSVMEALKSIGFDAGKSPRMPEYKSLTTHIWFDDYEPGEDVE